MGPYAAGRGAHGLRSWRLVYRDASTPATSSNRTIYSGSNRYITNTAPDGSYTVSAYTNGRPISVTRRDSINNQLSSITYGYDSHGRQSTLTDARNGTTIYRYSSGDLINSVTTPNPGTIGGSPQTTFTYYNSSHQSEQHQRTSVTHCVDVNRFGRRVAR